MKILILVLLLLLSGCLHYSGYPGSYGSQQYVDNYRALMYQQSLDRQELLMRQQNMILQQRMYR